MKNSSKVLIALGAGIAIGGLLGVLFAPAKGEETRKKIKDAGRKFADRVKDEVRKEKEKFSGLKQGMKVKMEPANGSFEEEE